MQDAVNLLRFRLRDLGCQVNLSLPANECWLMADSAQIKQVIINLVLNAADAMDGQPNRQLHITHGALRRTFPSARFRHGPRHQTRTHRADLRPVLYHQVPRTAGTGLGLSVCFSVVKQHDGEISVAETSAKGSTFKVTLPCGEGATEPRPCPAILAPGRRPWLFQSCRVLIADDEEFVSGLVQEALR